MNFTAQRIPYRQTNGFSKIVLDYIDHATELRGFYVHTPSVKGITEAIEERKGFSYNRKVLVEQLKEQYGKVEFSETVKQNIEFLKQENTFTITTAHQPNIFTGPLYFIYKILHSIKLASFCKENFPQCNFVPVFYMGSEDADIDELGHCWINGEKLVWNTKQTGAVGRMKVDKQLLSIIENIKGQVGVLPFGNEVVDLIKSCYIENELIQDATFKLVNKLFGEFGLIVLIADMPELKRLITDVLKDDLLNQTASGIVEKTATNLSSAGYKVQANPREINLFYLKDDIRNRIEYNNSQFTILNSLLQFSKEEMMDELKEHPERFSPNVILRGLYQETILPNIAFIGGGGEMAYWLQLKDMFSHYKVPYPVLVLRNSFMILEKKWKEKIAKTGFSIEDYFNGEQELMNKLVNRDSVNKLSFNGTLTETENIFDKIKKQAASVDPTLAKHTEALKVQAVKRLKELEKKMLRVEKRKFSDSQRQIQEVRKQLFPNNGMQERIDNFIPYYAKFGREFIKILYGHSLNLEHEYVILEENTIN